jgi:hypothetical protein
MASQPGLFALVPVTSFALKQQHPISIETQYDMRTLTRLWFQTFSPVGPHESWRVV